MALKFKTSRKTKFAIGLLALALCVAFALPDLRLAQVNAAASTLTVEQHHQATVQRTPLWVGEFHLRNRPLTNEFSEKIFNEFIRTLDPQKIYFTAYDIEGFKSQMFYFDDYLQSGQLDQVINIFERFRERVADRTEFSKSILKESFDFGLDEELQIDRSEQDWFTSEEQYNGFWRRLVKNDLLTLQLNSGESSDEVQNFAELLGARYDQFGNTISRYNTYNVVELFLNSYLNELDPHSQYYTPHNTDNLQIRISQQIEGIGAMLRIEDGHTVVHSVITGGPAARSGVLHAGDKIVAVGNKEKSSWSFRDLLTGGSGGSTGSHSASVDIDDQPNTYHNTIGWRLEDVVDLIRGPKGTRVYLKVIPKDSAPGSSPKNISIVREKVNLLDQTVRKQTYDLDVDGQPVLLAVIHLPAFYSKFFESDSASEEVRSSASDVAKILVELEQQNVDGIVMDLRGNGGGALNEAVNLTGLFIESGPVVQVKKANNELQIRSDPDETVFYDGPLVVLVDRASASASEIFAAAIQDYRRGIIVGETTFGKGSLQSIWPLDSQNNESAGSIKLSTAQFYRVNGVSTQHRGVVPDIVFPTDESTHDVGERALKNALPGDVINPADSTIRWPNAETIEKNIPTIRHYTEERIIHNPVITYLTEIEQIREVRNSQKTISLNKIKRMSDLEKDNKAQLDTLNRFRSALRLDSVEELNDDDTTEPYLNNFFLNETLNILADLITLNASS